MSSSGSGTSPYTALLVETPTPGVLLVKFNRPRSKHAWSHELVTEMTTVLRMAKDDESVQVVVVSSVDDFFSSGANLASPPQDGDVGFRNSAVGLLMWDWMHFPKPIVAAVTGGAVGVGFTCLLHCDILYASKNAYFMTPFARIALAPEFVSSMILPEILGPSLANEMLLAGKILTSEEALRVGLVSSIHATPADTIAVAMATAKQMVSWPVANKTLPLFKRMLRNPTRMRDMQYIFNMEGGVLDMRRANGETAEGIMAFFQKKNASKL